MKAGISSYQEESLMDDVLKICSEGKKSLKSVQEEGGQFRDVLKNIALGHENSMPLTACYRLCVCFCNFIMEPF